MKKFIPQFEMFKPSKLVFMAGPEKPDAAVESPEEMQQKHLDKIRQTSWVAISKLQETKTFKELKKFDKNKADKHIATTKSFVYKNGDKKEFSQSIKNKWNVLLKGKESLDDKSKKIRGFLKEYFESKNKEISRDAEENRAFREIAINEELSDEAIKKSVKSILTDMMSDDKEPSPKQVEALYKAVLPGVSKLRDNAVDKIIEDPKAFKDGYLSLNLEHAVLKTFNAQSNAIISEAAQRSLDAADRMPEKTGTTYFDSGSSRLNEKAKSNILKFVTLKIAPKLKAGQLIRVQIDAFTSVEGVGNEALVKKRAEAQKSAIRGALTKVLGKGWERKYKEKLIFVVNEKQKEPKLLAKDLPAGVKNAIKLKQFGKAFVAAVPSLSFLKPILKEAKSLKDVIAAINKVQPAQKRLYAIIALITDNKAKPTAVMSDFNSYMKLMVSKSLAAAEKWLSTKGHSFLKNRQLLQYLLTFVAGSRSAETKVLTEKESKLFAMKDMVNKFKMPGLTKKLVVNDEETAASFKLPSGSVMTLRIDAEINAVYAVFTHKDNQVTFRTLQGKPEQIAKEATRQFVKYQAAEKFIAKLDIPGLKKKNIGAENIYTLNGKTIAAVEYDAFKEEYVVKFPDSVDSTKLEEKVMKPEEILAYIAPEVKLKQTMAKVSNTLASIKKTHKIGMIIEKYSSAEGLYWELRTKGKQVGKINYVPKGDKLLVAKMTPNGTKTEYIALNSLKNTNLVAALGVEKKGAPVELAESEGCAPGGASFTSYNPEGCY